MFTNHSHFNKVVTGDKSWFIYINEQKARWVLVDDNPGDVLEILDYQKKKMVNSLLDYYQMVKILIPDILMMS